MKSDAIYARYSSHAQDDGTSIEVQIEQCERAAGRACKHYVDRAKTGRATGGRTQLLAMLQDAADGKVGRVFVYKFDRLGRAAETHVIAQQLDDAGVELISATEGTNALARGIQLVVAEDYSRQLATRTRDGLIKRFEQGGYAGGVPPYGYRVVTRDRRRVLEVEPAEADVVRQMATWYLTEAVGFKSIAKRLRERGVASRRGKGWTFGAVRALLINPILTGTVRFNVRKMQLNRTTGKRVARAKAEGEHVERRDETLRILPDDTFGQIQDRIGRASRGETPRAPRGLAPFTGLVYCQCGAKCFLARSSNAKGSYTYYACGRQMRYGDCPFKTRIRETVLVDLVNTRLARVFDRTEETIARACQIAANAMEGNRAGADRLKGEIAAVEQDQTRLVELLMDRDISPVSKQAINRKLAEAEAELGRLREALDGLREDATNGTDEFAAVVREVFVQARAGFERVGGTNAEFNRLVEQFVGPMEVKPDGSIVQKKQPPEGSEGCSQPIRLVAGGRFQPNQVIVAAFWNIAEAA